MLKDGKTYGPRLVHSGIPDLLPMQRTGDPADHVSHILRRICIALGHYADDSGDELSDADLANRQTRWELGSAFENAIIMGLRQRYAASDPDRFIVPGELQRDGLIGSPDLCDVTDQAIIEVKLTWLSTRNDAESEKFWKFWRQGMAYAYMMDWKTVRLHVGHIMGDYSRNGPPQPVYNVWEWEFTEQDLANNWRMLLSNRKAADVGKR